MKRNQKNFSTAGEKARVAIRTSLIRARDKQGDTEEERRQNMEAALSPQTQLGIGRDYCERQSLVLDEAASLSNAALNVSGSKIPWRNRPDTMRHYEDAKKGLFQHLVVYKLARAGRNLRDTLDMIDAFEKVGVTIHGIKEGVVSSNRTDGMLMNLLLVFAEEQANDTSSNIQDAVLTRAKRGDINGRYPLIINLSCRTARRLPPLGDRGIAQIVVSIAFNRTGFRLH